LLVRAGAPAAELPSRRCVAGDTHPTRGRLSEAVVVEADRTGDPAADVGAVDPERPATAGAVAGRLGSAACRVVLWTGGTDALDLLLAAAPEVRTVVGSSRIKTEGGIAVGVTHPARRIVAVCACADVTLSDDPIQQRFIHDYQTESGSAPGPFSVEAYDAGRWLLRAAAEGARGPVAETVRRAGAVEGLLGTYRLDSDGALVSSPAAAGTWRAFGSRWLPLDPGSVPPLASALPLAGVLARVRPRKRPWAPTIHRSGEGT
ncbi:MAG TPA: hypothetical protein VFQ40_04520, partial [Actinomycetota bacterium]|nr:hypothetical protein [Actinomycetota bacterium]